MLKLKELYKKKIVPLMMEEFKYKNVFAVPKIEKVTINTCFGKLISNKTPQEIEKIKENILNDLTLIAGQKPIPVKAKKSISGFGLKKNTVIAYKVTLRGDRMYEFLERLIYLALPRSRDFKGIDPRSFDQFGNLTIGIKEHIAFPEVSLEKEKNIFPLEVTITTTSKTKEEGIKLLKLFGFPIK
jgi:large subunit ribosomal protein L5